MDGQRRDYDYADYDRDRRDYSSYDRSREERRRTSSRSDRKRSRRRRYSDDATSSRGDYRAEYGRRNDEQAEHYRRRSRSLTRNHRSRGSNYYRSDRRRSTSRSRSRSRSKSRDDRRSRRYRRSRSYDDGRYYRSRRHGRSYSLDRRHGRRSSRSESPPSRRRGRYDDAYDHDYNDRRSRSRDRSHRRRDYYHHHQDQHHDNHRHHHQLQAVVSDYSSGGEHAPELPPAGPAAPSAAAAAVPAASASASAWSAVQQEASHRSRSRSRSGRSNGRSRRVSRKQKKSRKERRRRRRGSDRRSRSRSSSRSKSSYDDRKRSSRKSRRKQKSDRRKKKDRRPRSTSSPSSSAGDSSDRDDTVGHFEGGPGTMVADRYRIVKDVGLGTFGRVVECIDTKQEQGHVDPTTGRRTDRVAIKVVRNIKRYYDSALIEADIVQDVNRRGGRGLTLNSILYDRFALPTNHYCLVFECLGPSLYDFIKKHEYRPFPLYCVRDFAQQLLEALEFLHSFHLIHTDLKPENILLCTSEEVQYRDEYDGSTQMVPASTRIKIIDFGGATYDNEKKSSTICTRQYRPPEVILGLHPWSMPADLWSAACIVAELYIGELLFGTHDNAEHLALIERAVGPFPREMVSRATANGDVFDSRGLHRGRDVLSSSSFDHVRRMEPIEAIVCDHDRHSGLIELLHALLVIDPSRRATATEALSDPIDGMFFK